MAMSAEGDSRERKSGWMYEGTNQEPLCEPFSPILHLSEVGQHLEPQRAADDTQAEKNLELGARGSKSPRGNATQRSH